MAKMFNVEFVSNNAFITEVNSKEFWSFTPLKSVTTNSFQIPNKITIVGDIANREICFEQINSISFDGVAFTLTDFEALVVKISAYTKALSSSSGALYSKSITASAGSTLTDAAFVGKTIKLVVSGGLSATDGFTLTGSTITFTDGTTFTNGQNVVVIYS